MTKLLIGVRKSDPDDGMLRVYVEDGSVLADAGRLSALNFNPQTQKLDTLENVELYGKTLCAALEKHAAIKTEFAQLFNVLGNESALEFLVIAGEDVRWESLCDANARFLALNDACSMARVTTMKCDGPKPRQVELPLKMLAYLSPAGVSSADEFKNLCTQIVAAREGGLKIEAIIYVGEQEILDAPEKFSGVAKERFHGVTTAPMPLASQIEEQLKGAYQFVHFFCHGIDKGCGQYVLSLATIADQENGAQTGSVGLSIDTVATTLGLNRSVWMAVFNSCSGAAGTHSFNSLALKVAKYGCPYAVGMAEPIEPVVAAKFSGAFYQSLFKTAGDALRVIPKDTYSGIDLSKVIVLARKVIRDHCQQDEQGAYGRWLTPLIYTHIPNPLIVYLPSVVADPEMVKRINTIAGTLRVLPRDSTAVDVRKRIYALFDQPPVVPRALRPDPYGQFHANGVDQ